MESKNHDSHYSTWSKVKILGGLTASILIPIVLAVVGNGLTSTIKDREIAQNYIELATGILKESPEENNKAIRKWAINIINHYSEVKMDTIVENELQNNRIRVYSMTDNISIASLLNKRINLPHINERLEYEIFDKIVKDVLPLINEKKTIEEVLNELDLPVLPESSRRLIIEQIFKIHSEGTSNE